MSGGASPIGLYLHVPFCDGKCPYCDFYSMRAGGMKLRQYMDALLRRIRSFQGRGIALDTVYFGGGTPSLLGDKRLARLLGAVRESFALAPGAEITVEVNPTREPGRLYQGLREAGVNRISLGLQSAQDGELRLLGRRHTAAQAARAVEAARQAGFSNISLDLMLATPGQTEDSLRRSIQFCGELGVEHVSAYLLKIEPGTEFHQRQASLSLPGEDETAARYLLACRELEAAGYAQYEISNFARPGFPSRHNLKYWHCEEYLGLGPSAHSFFEGRRFYYPRSLTQFLLEEPPVQDGEGGGFEEFAMLALRLTEGLREDRCQARFGHPIPAAMRARAEPLARAGYCALSPEGIRLTRQGFLVSNSVISRLIL